jgi:hypothetical protein
MLRATPGGGNRRAFGHEPAQNVFSDNELRVWVTCLHLPRLSHTDRRPRRLRRPDFPGTIPRMKRLIAPSLVIAICGMAAARDQGPATEITSKAVAKLEAKLGESEIQIDEVRVTDDGIACMDFHGTGGTSGRKAHAVLQGEELLISTNSDVNGFEKAWKKHCLGPRGGTTPAQ